MTYGAVMIKMCTNNNYNNQILSPLDLFITTLLTIVNEGVYKTTEEKLDEKLKENDENIEQQDKVIEELNEARDSGSDSSYIEDLAQEVAEWGQYIQESQDEILALVEVLNNSFSRVYLPLFLPSIRIGFVIAFAGLCLHLPFIDLLVI